MGDLVIEFPLQVVMLQKALAASGASPEEIAAILAKAAGNGLDDDEISSIMSAVMGNSDLSKEDVENMMNLQKSLKTGGFRKAGVTPEVMKIQGGPSGCDKPPVNNKTKVPF